MSTRVKGHALQGWKYTGKDLVVTVCECGAESEPQYEPVPPMESDWHRQHKAEVLKSQSADGGTE